jgi:hypothetical protein
MSDVMSALCPQIGRENPLEPSAKVMIGSILGRKPARVPSKDGRSADAVLLRRTRAAMTAHVGGKPTATQKALIDRAAMLTLHLARMDTKAMEAGEMSDHASRQYLAWSNTLTRTLRTLGLEAVPPPVKTLAQHLAEKAAARS